MSDEVEFVDVAMRATVHGPDEFIEYVSHVGGGLLGHDERYAAGEFVGRGTHDGLLRTPAGEVAPIGHKLDERFTWFTEAAEGKLTGARDYYNAMAIMLQLGLMPEPAEATR